VPERLKQPASRYRERMSVEQHAPPARTRPWRTVAVGAALALALIGAGVGAQRLAAPSAPVAPAAQGSPGGLGAVSGAEQRPLPPARLDGFAGADPVDLAAYRGAPLVVNFWATWCPPCVDELPDLEQVAGELDGRVAFLGINALDRPDEAEALVAETGVTFDLAADPQGEYFERVSGVGWPTTLLVDEGGTIRYRRTGPLDAAELRALVGAHLGVR
jgi:cytochrome c biogenesis protein CcmG, thiol:disulfide interchange protein DsbE